MEINRSFYKPVELTPLVGLFASELTKAVLTVCKTAGSEFVNNIDKYGAAAIIEGGLAMQGISVWLGSEGYVAPGVVLFVAGLIPEALGGMIMKDKVYNNQITENIA